MASVQHRVHVLGLGSIGAVNAFLLQTAFPQLSICHLPRNPASSRETVAIHLPTGEIKRLTDINNDAHGTSAIDVLLVTTKANQTRTAVSANIPRFTKSTLMIFLQNGMGIVDSIRDILPSRRIVLGTTVNGAYRTDIDQIHWVYHGSTIFSPESSSTNLSPHELSILSAMGRMVDYPTLERRLYWKLAMNACINPAAAIYNVVNSEVGDPLTEAHGLAVRLAKEIKSVYARLRPDLDTSTLVEEMVQVARDTGRNRNSMLADLRSRRPTEIWFINGYIVKMGHSLGVDVVENEACVRKVTELENCGT